MPRPFAQLAVVSLAICCGIPLAALSSPPPADVLMETMQREIQRATTSLAKSDPAPYFLSYTANDAEGITIAGENGSIVVSSTFHRRGADVVMRVGAAALDNTHNQSRPSGIVSGALPLQDNTDAIARVLWQLTNQEYDPGLFAGGAAETRRAIHAENVFRSERLGE